MAHELSKLKVSFPLWRVWWDESEKIHARRLFPPREGEVLIGTGITDLEGQLERAEAAIRAEVHHPPARPIFPSRKGD